MNGGFSQSQERLHKDKTQVMQYLDKTIVDGRYIVYNNLNKGDRILIRRVYR